MHLSSVAADEIENESGDKMDDGNSTDINSNADQRSGAVVVAVAVAEAACSTSVAVFDRQIMDAVESLSFNVVSTKKKEQQFQACVMTLYVQAIRTHVMTLPFFRGKRSYASLKEQEQQIKPFLESYMLILVDFSKQIV